MHADATKQLVKIQVPGKLESMSLLRKTVADAALQEGLDRSAVDQLEVAVDEACTNIVEHGYASYAPAPDIVLTVLVQDNKFIVDIVDFGLPFDFESHTPPSFPQHWEQGHTRGAGIFLIKQCLDETAYETLSENKNRLRLVKYIQPST